MFRIAVISDVISVEPRHMNKDYTLVLSKNIKAKYLNKVLTDVGLVVALYEITEIENNNVLILSNNDGIIRYALVFKLLVFRPCLNQLIKATISSIDHSGINVSLDFFKDVKIPNSFLREPKGLDSDSMQWWWEFDGHRLYYEVGKGIRFKVNNIKFNNSTNLDDGQDSMTSAVAEDNYTPPMIIVGRVDEDGLGMTSWWD